MDKGDFNSWEEAVKFYKEEYKDLPLEEFMDRMMMRWEDGEFEDAQAFSREVEDGIKLYSNRPEKKSVGQGGRPKGQWEKAHRRHCAIGEMFEARKRLSRESIRAIAGYIFTDLENNPKKHLGEKKNPYSSVESVYDIIKRRKWEKRPIG
jgi:hypothetical protein